MSIDWKKSIILHTIKACWDKSIYAVVSLNIKEKNREHLLSYTARTSPSSSYWSFTAHNSNSFDLIFFSKIEDSVFATKNFEILRMSTHGMGESPKRKQAHIWKIFLLIKGSFLLRWWMLWIFMSEFWGQYKTVF